MRCNSFEVIRYELIRMWNEKKNDSYNGLVKNCIYNKFYERKEKI